ncbi:MAG: hypothetical protein QOE66_449 [Chloroflexota bacterium]|nr:hypothetical protein [Chloroflexota bacterium]
MRPIGQLRSTPPRTPRTRTPGLQREIGLVVALLLAACSPGPSSSQPSLTPEGTKATATAISIASPIRALDAHLVGPVGLLFDPAGNLYVSDCGPSSSYIHRIDPSGMMTTYAGAGPTDFSGDGGPAVAAALWCPIDMAFGPDGAMYFADDSNRIRRIDTSGIITTVVGSGPAGINLGSFSGDGGPAMQATLDDPWGVAFDRKGNLYIGERLNRRVRQVDLSGVITTVAGTGENASSGDGGPAARAGVCPLGVGVDASDRLLMFDSCSSRIRRVDGHGVISTVASTGSTGFSGGAGPAPGAAGDVAGHIAVDAQGNAFFAIGGLIDRVDGTTGETSVVDLGHLPALVYASDLSAPIRQIYGMAVDRHDNLYISDGLASVYRIDPQGVLTIFAGKR